MSRLLSSLALGALCATAVAQSPLTTINPFAANNGGSVGGVVFFDLQVNTGVLINSLDTNYSATAGTAVGIQVYTVPGTYVGNEANAGAWTLVGQDNGTATSAARNGVTSIPLAASINLTPGSYGVALVAVGSAHAYTNGTGTNQSFSTAEMTITLGAAQNVPFTGSPITPRVWNGAIHYTPAVGLFASFDAAPTSGDVPLQVQFTDTSFSSAPGGVVAWLWDFQNDGTVDSALQNPTFTYTQEGVYSVSLTAIDGTHPNSTVVRNNLIEVGLVNASFTFALTGASSVQFTDTSAGAPTSWSWDFESDGIVDSNAQNPSFTYPGPGSYDVTLAVADAISNDTATVTIGVSILPVSPYSSTYTSSGQTRGFWFQTPVAFSIVSLQVPDESGHGLQNVAVYNLGQVPPTYTATMPGVPIFFSGGTSSATPIPTALSFAAGDYVGLIGACGDASTMRSSYGAGPFASSIFGQPTTLTRLITQTNIVSNSGVAPLSGTTGAIGRVHVGISAATGLPYGTSTPSGSGAAAPELTTTGLPRLGLTAELTVDQQDASALGFLVVGLGRLNLPTPFGTWLVNNVITGLPVNGGAVMAPGQYTFQLSVPASASLNGAGPLNWQNINSVPGSPNGISASNGQEWFLAY